MIEPGMPQHNGVPKRIKRTIVKNVRSILRMSKLPRAFWGEVVRIRVCIINIAPSVPLQFEIPKRFWTGKNASYIHLKDLGARPSCMC